MGGEGGVVAAAVLGVEGEADVQHVGLPEGVGGVRPQQGEDVLRRGQLRLGGVYVKAVPALVGVGLVAVDAEYREQGDELETLAHDVGQGDIVAPLVIGGQVQHAAGQGIHNILAGRLQNDIPHEVAGQGTVVGQLVFKALQLRRVGQAAQQEQIGGLLKAEPPLLQRPRHQLLYIDAAVVELAVAGDLLPIHHFFGDDVGDLGQARQNALAVEVAEAALDVVSHIVPRVNAAVLQGLGRQRFNLRGDIAVVWIARHRKPPFFRSALRTAERLCEMCISPI